ncbi:MAG: YvcK family protein [Anaerolineae bacterium]|nr:YvcK family protein [Anaerolineae bacterium]
MQHLPLFKWLRPDIGIKRWVFLALVGILLVGLGITAVVLKFVSVADLMEMQSGSGGWLIFAVFATGCIVTTISLRRLMNNILAPYQRHQRGELIDMMVEHRRRKKGFKYVAIGGGTGLPASLRGMKLYTSNITAVVTVADDGGSSGRLRRDMGVPPPGDLRNNIAALADDESLLTQLFQYRFQGGDLAGHSFGNLFIAALADIVHEKSGNKRNSLAEALVEVERVLSIQGRVLPATLDEVNLAATVKLKGSSRTIKVRGEAHIEEVDGLLDSITVYPENVEAYQPSVQAILEADLIVIGPGSLYTSILPNLMIKGIADALRATNAYKIYVCNVATQPVETEDYSVAEHVMAMEKHIGRGVFQAVLANNVFPIENAGQNTHYVMAAPEHHEISQRYEVRYTDLTDSERPWRHDPFKLAVAILQLANIDVDIESLV